VMRTAERKKAKMSVNLEFICGLKILRLRSELALRNSKGHAFWEKA